jgi:hypothetical protein
MSPSNSEFLCTSILIEFGSSAEEQNSQIKFVLELVYFFVEHGVHPSWLEFGSSPDEQNFQNNKDNNNNKNK